MSSTVDLHVHSYFSDGKQSPEEVIDLAKSNGVTTLSFVEHDSTRSFKRASSYAQKVGLTCIPGVEITTQYKNGVIHMLGYGFNVEDEALQSLFTELSDKRKSAVMEKVQEVNTKLEQEHRQAEIINTTEFVEEQHGFFNRWKLVEFLQKKNIVSSREEALALTEGVKVSVNSISPEVAIRLIHGAGGIAVMAHPFGPKISLDAIGSGGSDLADFKSWGLDGIECYQPSHSEDATGRALEAASRYGFFVSAGTDWHGPLEAVGEGVKVFVPQYVSHPGELNVPVSVQSQLLHSVRGGEL